MSEKPFGANCCDARWGGFNTAHCASCHVTFSTVGNFDRHRRGGECLDPLSLTDREGRPQPMVKNRHGYWGQPGDGFAHE